MRFTKDHQWVALNGDIAVTGVSAWLAQRLGDVLYLDLPEAGAALQAGGPMAKLEGANGSAPLAAPLSATVAEANTGLSDGPELVNTDPEGSAWLTRLTLADPAQFDGLMDRAAYEAYLDTL